MAKSIWDKAADEIKKTVQQAQQQAQKQSQQQTKKTNSRFYDDYQAKKVQPSTVQSTPQKKTFVPVTRQQTAFVPSTVVQQPQRRKFVPVTKQDLPAYTQIGDLANNRVINRFTPRTGAKSNAPATFTGSIYGTDNFTRSLPKAQNIFKTNQQQQELLKRQQERDRQDFGNLYGEEMEKQRKRTLEANRAAEYAKRGSNPWEERMAKMSGNAINWATENVPKFSDWVWNGLVLKGLSQFNSSLMSGLDFVLPTEVLGDYDFVKKGKNYYKGLEQGYAQEANRASENLGGGGWNVASDLGAGVVAAVPQAAIALGTGGASAGANGIEAVQSAGTLGSATLNSIKTAMQSPAFYSSYLMEAGGLYDDAKEKGASETEATVTGLVGGYLNALLEMSGGIEGLAGKEGTLKNWLVSGIEEGLEETSQGAVGKSVEKLVYDKDKKLFSIEDDDAIINPKRAGMEFAGGALAGGVLGGVPTAINAYTDTVNTGRAINELGEGQSVINQGLASERESAANRYAQRLQRKATPSDWNIGRQFQKNVAAIQSENDFAAAMSNIKPTEITATLYNDRGQELNGIATDSGVSVSVNGDIDVPTAIKHEWLHMFEKLNPEVYKEYRASVLSAARETNSEAVESRIKFLKDNYGYEQTVAEDEIVAELTGGFNTKAIGRMAQGNNGLVSRLADAMRTAKRELRQAYTDGRYTSNTGLQLTFEQLNNAEKSYIQGLKQARENTAQTGAERSSIIEKPNGDYKVIADRDIFNGVAEADKISTLKKFLNENIRGQLYTALSDGAPLNVAQKNKTLQKLYRPGIPMNTDKYNARLETVLHYDEVLAASQYDTTEPAKNNKHGQSPSDKRIVEIEIPKFDNSGKLTGSSVWEAEISVINNENLAYDISKLRDITKNTHSDLRNLQQANPNIDRVSLPGIISQQGNFVKQNNYKASIKESSRFVPNENAVKPKERFVPKDVTNQGVQEELPIYTQAEFNQFTTEQKDKYKDAARVQKEIMREKTAEGNDRNKLLRLAREVQKMKLSDEARSNIPDIINQIDTVSKGILKKGYTTSDGRIVRGRLELQNLKAEYEDIAKTNPDWLPDKNIEAKIGRLDKLQISDMDIDTVRELIQTIQEVKHEVRTHNKLINDAKNRQIVDVARETVKEINGSKGSNYLIRRDDLMNKYITTQLTPLRMFKRLAGYKTNSALVGLAEALNDGQRKSLAFQQKATRKFDNIVSDKKAMRNFTGAKAELIDISEYAGDGKELYITPAMRVSLYLHSKNYDNLRHIANGGIKIPNIRAYVKGDFAKANDAGYTVKLSPSQVKSITDKMSDFEKRFADVAYDFFNNDTKKAVNETSLDLKGYELATTEDYFPISTDKNFTRMEFESLLKDGTLEGMGILKSRTGASNPIMLEDVTKVISRHMKSVGDYYGLAIPIRNFNSVYNFTGSNYAYSTKQALSEKWGSVSKKYIENLITDLQGGRNGGGETAFDKAISTIKSNYAQAVLAANPTVIAQQAASYPTAAAIVGWKPLMQGLTHKVTKADIDFINEHTPLLWYRSRGYSTSELGDYAEGTSEDWTKSGKARWVMGAIQKVDVATVTKLYKAAEYNIRNNYPNLEVGSEEFNNKVIDLYNRVIEETQPDYTTMQRPDILRNPNKAIGLVTMFKTQIMQNFNLLYDSTQEFIATSKEYKNNPTAENKEALNQSKTYFGRVMASQIVAATTIALMKAAGNAIKGKFKKRYGDKDSNVTWETALTRGLLDVAETLGGTALFGGEVISAIEGDLNGIEAPALTAINDFTKAAYNMFNVDYRNILDDPRQFISATDDLAKAGSKLLGVPYENIENIITGTTDNIITACDNTGTFHPGLFDGNEVRFAMEKAKTKLTDDNAKGFINILKNAKKHMDETEGEQREEAARVYERIYNELLENGVSEDKILKAIKEKQPKDTDFGADLDKPAVFNYGIPAYEAREQKNLAEKEQSSLREWSSNIGIDKRSGKVYFKDDDGNQYELTDKQAKYYKDAKEKLTAEARAALISGNGTIEEVLEGHNKFKLYADEMTEEQYEAAYYKKGQKEADRLKFELGKSQREVTLTGLYGDYPERVRKSIMSRVQTDIDEKLHDEMWEEVKANGIYYSPPSHARTKQTQQTETEIVQGRVNAIAQTVADEAPEYAERYGKAQLGIAPIATAKINGKEYTLSDTVSAAVTKAAKQDYAKNIEALENNEIKIEDITGYKNNGKPREMSQRNGEIVKKTGMLYNSDGTDRFDAVGKAKIYYDLKENAINYAIEQYKDEITGGASGEVEKVTTTGSTRSYTTARRSSGGRRSGGRSSGGGSSGSSGGGTRGRGVSVSPSEVMNVANAFNASDALFGSLGWKSGAPVKAVRRTPNIENIVKPKKMEIIKPLRMI